MYSHQTWIKEARMIAAQAWCDDENKNTEMDVHLAESFAKRLADWMEIGAQHARNEEYYRNLVIRCGKAIGHEAYVQDDGGVAEDVLCAKVPELVEALAAKNTKPVCPYCHHELSPTKFQCNNGQEYGWSCACLWFHEADNNIINIDESGD